MSTVVFCGPTLEAHAISRELDALVLPPARRGDLLRAALGKPEAILLIDGYFDRVQSTWHKEILWALREGIHVFGASSMGALRAAELGSFGMVGIGVIFQGYQGGELEDDDEVAIAHGDAESGYRTGSDAMVNIRATLRAAQRKQLISESTRLKLELRAKARPFYARSLRGLLREGLPTPELATLNDWLDDGFVDQKREDALHAVASVAQRARTGWSPMPVTFELAETDGWRALFDEVSADVSSRVSHELSANVQDELCLRGTHGRTLMAAMARWLASDRLSRANRHLNARAVEQAVEDFRRDRELLSAASFDEWLYAAKLDGAALEEFMRREATFRATWHEIRQQIGPAVADQLLAWGELEQMVVEAERKQLRLARNGLAGVTLADTALTREDLWKWFFRERLQRDVPDSIVAYATQEGATLEELERAAVRDFMDKQLALRSGSGQENGHSSSTGDR